MHRNLILLVACFLCWFPAQSAEKYTAARADSITYDLYLKGNWNQLIITSNEILKQHVDFKFLRQRMGYAYFMKANYYEARKQYEKALEFDAKDAITISYLYYSSLYLGDDLSIRFYGAKLPDDAKKYNKIQKNRWLNTADFEFNYKTSYSDRGAPVYLRVGLSSQIGSRWHLYQSFSRYTQPMPSNSTATSQHEYYLSATYTLRSHLSLMGSYHFVYSKSDGVLYPGHLLSGELLLHKDRFNAGLNGSYLKYDSGNRGQVGLTAGYTFPGWRYLHLQSSAIGAFESGNNRIIFTQHAGAWLLPKLWLDTKLTLGNLNNFAESNGLYLFNSADPTVFRCGGTLFWYLHPRLSLFGNYTFDQKEITDTNKYYYQHSFSGGLQWKF